MTRRLLLSYLALTLAVLAVLEVPLGFTFAEHERDQLSGAVERDAVVLASYVEDALERDEPFDSRFAERYAQESGARVVIVDKSGSAVLDTEGRVGRSFASRPEIEAALNGRVAEGRRHSETLGRELLFVAVPVASGGEVHGAVRVTYPTGAVDARIRRYWWILGAVAAVSMMAAAALGLVLARTVARPLGRLRDAAVAIGGGDLGRRSAVKEGPPVVRSLSASFDDMAARLEALVRSQDEFVADASHQLRNPLTALRLRLEILLGTASDDESKGDLRGALDEVARLSRLTDGLLTLARPVTEGAPAETVETDLAAIVSDRCDAWQALAEEHDIRIVADLPAASVPARATPDRISQALDNLIANAIDAAPGGTTVTVSVVPGVGSVDVHVVDQGPGMNADARARAFDRFWHGERSRPARLGGSGLGLAIAQKLTQADGGSIELQEAPGTGVDGVIHLRSGPP